MRSEEKSSSGIINQAIKIEKCNKRDATHMVVCHGLKIRYIISLQHGKFRISKGLSAYSFKLSLLMKIIFFLPLDFLLFMKAGYFAAIELDPEIKQIMQKENYKLFNIIVGSYDIKQKLVFQCFSPEEHSLNYVKAGNQNSDREMRAEIGFLRKHKNNSRFTVPACTYSHMRNSTHNFNIMITKEFTGRKVKPVLDYKIYRLFKEVSGKPVYIKNRPYGFSHGDFTPWNMKNQNGKYILFDWEHCGRRFYGYDLIHFAYMIERNLRGNASDEAVHKAVNMAQSMDEILHRMEAAELETMYISNLKACIGHD